MGLAGRMNRGSVFIRTNETDRRYLLRCERTEILKKRFRNYVAEIDTSRRVGCDNKEKCYRNTQ